MTAGGSPSCRTQTEVSALPELSPAIPNQRSHHWWQFNLLQPELQQGASKLHGGLSHHQHSWWPSTCGTPFTSSLQAWQWAGCRCFPKHFSPGAGIFLPSKLIPPHRFYQVSPSSPSSPTQIPWSCHTAHATVCSQTCLQGGNHTSSTRSWHIP